MARLRDWDYLRKWLVLGALIGVVAGLGAIVFIVALDGATKLLLETVGGYHAPLPFGEGNRLAAGSFARPWAIPLVVALGGLISGILVFRFAPEAEGHGTDAAITAVHHNPRGIRARVTLIKLLASAITIGSGGSAGREGPTAQISAGFGSMLARRLQLSPQDARIAVTVGIGAGIGAIFRAPLGGAVLGAEILYRDDLEPEAIFPSLVASIIGFSIFGAVEGFDPIFGNLHVAAFGDPLQLVWYAVLGLAAGLVGRAYARTFYATIALRRRFPGPDMLKPAVAGLLVGLIGLGVPAALGTGYGWVQRGMHTGLPATALWIILLIPLVKIVATSLSIGSGGSGGIFGPGMVIGAFVGLGLWRALDGVAGLPHGPAPFMVVGMMACFGSIAHAPLAVMLMVAEMTGSLALLPPAMIALGLATVVVGQHTIYESQLRSRVDAPAHRAAFGLPLLSSIPVLEAMQPPSLVLQATTPVGDARRQLEAHGVVGAPVVNDHAEYIGVLTQDASGGVGADTAGALADIAYPTVAADRGLDAALDAIVSAGITWVPVTDERHIRGVISVPDIISGYQQALRTAQRRLAEVNGNAVLVEATISEASPFAQVAVADAPWPRGTIALSIDRHSQLIAPQPTTMLEPGDVIVAVVPADSQQELGRLLRGAN